MNKKLKRQIELVNMLCEENYPALAELAKEFGCAERTIERDIDELRNGGADIEQNVNKGNGYCMSSHWDGRIYDTELEDLEAELTVEKNGKKHIKKHIKKHVKKHVKKQDTAVVTLITAAEEKEYQGLSAEVLSVVMTGWLRAEKIRITFKNDNGEIVTIFFEPHAIVCSRNTLPQYVAGYKVNDDELILLEVEQIIEAQSEEYKQFVKDDCLQEIADKNGVNGIRKLMSDL